MGLAVHHDIGDFADFDRKRVFGPLDLLYPEVAVVSDTAEFALQFAA
ncbi:hypothetical protein [Mycobacterium xenopi]|nr:hypothetical protein [Mycobacterium xenopi]